MIWFGVALVLALPVLLGLIPGMDAAGARKLVLRSASAGGFVGVLAGVFLDIMTRAPVGAILTPVVWGTLVGAGIGLVGVAVRRFILRGPGGPTV